MSNKFDTYILEIYRNHGIHAIHKPKGASSINHSNPYNELRYKKLCGDQKSYLYYFRINDIFQKEKPDNTYGNEQCKTLLQTLSLYQRANASGEKDPLTDEGDSSTDKKEPSYLILIQIRLYRTPFLRINNGKKQDVEAFLKKTEEFIEKKIKKIFTPAELEDMTLKIFRSSTTGDFCLAIRTANAGLIEKTANNLLGCAIHASLYMTAWERIETQKKDIIYIGIPDKTRSVSIENNAPGKRDTENYWRNEYLFIRIIGINRYRKYFAQENRSFQDLFQATKELYWTYSAAAWEKDTEINWWMWYQDMLILCKCMKEHMKAYRKIALDEEEKRRKFRLEFLQSWRVSIMAIDRYTRLVIGVNDQDHHTSVFEAQTQIDAEKIMVAYRESMRVYYRGYDKECAGRYHAKISIEPIVYPSLLKEKIEVTTPFANITANDQSCERGIVCTVPSFEYFGRYYDMLPLLMHEAAHSIRIMERPTRNAFLRKYTLKHVFKAVITQLLQELPDAKRYTDMGAATGELLKAFQKVAESETRKYAKEKLKIDRLEDANFEQTANVLMLYLQELFPQEPDTTKDFEKARDRLLEMLISEFRQNGMLENPTEEKRQELLADLQVLNDSGAYVENAEKLIKNALIIRNKRLIDQLPDVHYKDDELFSIKDFNILIKSLDQKIFAIRKTLEERLADPQEKRKRIPVLDEYIFFATKLFRLYKMYRAAESGYQDPEKKREVFLEKVFDEYQKMTSSNNTTFSFPSHKHDPETMYFLNYMGLLGTQKDVFYKQCNKAFAKLPFKTIFEYKNLRTRIYRETCADVMMALSLKLTAFGYCRQIFRVISDTAQKQFFGRYESVDFVRFRTVTALLLLNGKAKKEAYGEDEYKINGESLLTEGERYCENYLKYIREIIFKQENIVSREAVYSCFGDINEQIKILIRDFTTTKYRKTLLYVLLHGEHGDLPEEVRTYWKRYPDLKKICQKYRQHFWRLECFCIGLHYILYKNDVIVERIFFDHMLELQKNIADTSPSHGCVWEKELWPCMSNIKEKVGDYYNDPESVFTVSDAEKLEDTIEFIQNFYYHNRAAMAREEEKINGEFTKESISKG